MEQKKGKERMTYCSYLTHEREAIIAKVFRKLGMENELKERWKKINYKPTNQLTLEL